MRDLVLYGVLAVLAVLIFVRVVLPMIKKPGGAGPGLPGTGADGIFTVAKSDIEAVKQFQKQLNLQHKLRELRAWVDTLPTDGKTKGEGALTVLDSLVSLPTAAPSTAPASDDVKIVAV